MTYSGVYFPMARVAPWLMDWGYQISNQPFATEPTLPIWDRLNAAPLARFIREYRPDIAICTHFMPAGILGQLIARGQVVTSLSIVVTDYDFHGIWLSRIFSRYFVALEETRALLWVGVVALLSAGASYLPARRAAHINVRAALEHQ